MNELEAKCYLTKKGGANNSDHTCRAVICGPEDERYALLIEFGNTTLKMAGKKGKRYKMYSSCKESLNQLSIS